MWSIVPQPDGERHHQTVGNDQAEAEDVAAQDQGFISAKYYWQWLADYVVSRKMS